MSDQGNGRRGDGPGGGRRGGRPTGGRPDARRPRDDGGEGEGSFARDRGRDRTGRPPRARREDDDRRNSQADGGALRDDPWGKSRGNRLGQDRPGSRGQRPETRRRPHSGRPDRPKAGERLADLDELEVTIEKLVEGGEGLARFEGIPIFIPRSAPGDRLKVRLSERKPGFGRAEIVEILEAGPGRREAPCPHFDVCGGCDLQHLDEKTQLRAKAEAVVETLRRIGGLEELPPRFEIVAGESWGYRLRTQLHVRENERGAQAGYFARASHDLLPVENCPILVPQLENTLRRLPRLLRTGPIPARFDLAAGDGESFTCSPPHEKLPKGEVTTTVGEFAYEYDARCFFQAHGSLTERLVREAMGDDVLGTDPDNEDTAGEHAFDLYAGVGLFALPLSKRYRHVTAVDGDRVAIRFARRNARQNGRSHVQTVAQVVESWVSNLPEGAERVLVDPPRAGLSARVRGLMLSRRPRRLTYVSCQPATLARDLKILGRLYAIDSLALLDMFPQTGHMESVVQLRLKD